MKKSIVKNVLRISIYGIVPLSVMLYLLLLLFSGEKKFTLFPGSNVQTGVFGDYTEDGGNSIINGFEATRQRIRFTYTLKGGFFNPYAGFAVRSNGWMNLKPYTAMKIRICSTQSRFVRVFLFTKIAGYTRENDSNTYFHLQKEIAIQKDCLAYTVKLADLTTPEWWYERELSESDPRLTRDFTRVYSISIQSGTTQPTDIVDMVTLEEISFYKDNRRQLVMLIIVFLIYCGAVFSFFRFRQHKNRLAKKVSRVVLACRDILPEHGYDEETCTIIKYIGENYWKRDLSVDTVSRACRMPVMKIPQHLKKYFDLSFPQYLNAIRLAEAKRLLSETDLMISEIAFRVGFNSIPHFNRIFKDNERISPKDFRKTISDFIKAAEIKRHNL